MMIKTKTCFTILVVYEIVAIILLHLRGVCSAMFGATFCADSVFKYFIACVAIPLLALLIAMWVREIVVSVHRHHSLMYKAKSAMSNMVHDAEDRISENVSSHDIEKYLTAAALIGIKRYTDTHPRVKQMIREVVDNVRGEVAEYDAKYHDVDNDDADSEYDHDPHGHISHGSVRTTYSVNKKSTLKKTAHKKK